MHVDRRARENALERYWLVTHSQTDDPPPGRRTRRKFVRLWGGSASCRRICSTSARSLSLRITDGTRLRGLGFFLLIESPSDHRKRRPVLRAVSGFLAANDIAEIGHEQLRAPEIDA